MKNRHVQEHGITVIGSTSSSDAAGAAATADPSSSGSGGSTNGGGNHDNDGSHRQQHQVQLPFEELVQCIRSVPIRVANVHYCVHGGGREGGGEKFQERTDVFTDLLSKEAKMTTKIHTGTFGWYYLVSYLV